MVGTGPNLPRGTSPAGLASNFNRQRKISVPRQDIPVAIRDYMYAAYGVPAVVLPLQCEDGEYESWVAIPAELAHSSFRRSRITKSRPC